MPHQALRHKIKSYDSASEMPQQGRSLSREGEFAAMSVLRYSIALVLYAALLSTSSAQSWNLFSNAGNPRAEVNPIEEQPGRIADSADEALPEQYQKQLVFFRTSEPPGTVIV